MSCKSRTEAGDISTRVIPAEQAGLRLARESRNPVNDSSRASPRPLALVLVIASMLSACSDIYYDRRETVALGADDHIASNMVAQMIDPWPRYVGNKNLAFDGMRMQAAADRYRRDCVIPPYPMGTTVLAVQQQAVQASAAGCIAGTSTGLGSGTTYTPSSNASTQTPAPSAPSATASSK